MEIINKRSLSIIKKVLEIRGWNLLVLGTYSCLVLINTIKNLNNILYDKLFIIIRS